MKYLYEHPRTSDLLSSWRPGRLQIDAWFFFNDRGTQIRKSLQGLLHEILFAITSFDKRLADIILPMYAEKPPNLRVN